MIRCCGGRTCGFVVEGVEVELWGILVNVAIAMSAIEHGLEGNWNWRELWAGNCEAEGFGLKREIVTYLRSSLCTTHAPALTPMLTLDLSTPYCTTTVGYRRIEKNSSR